MKTKYIITILIAFVLSLALPVSAQVYPTDVKPALAGLVNCQTTTTNLAASLLVTNDVPQGQNLGIGVQFFGGNASNTATVGLQWRAQFAGTNKLLTTTTTFTTTHTGNGTTIVRDWAVIAPTTIGPADKLVLVGITNAVVNVNGSSTAGGIQVSNVWLQY